MIFRSSSSIYSENSFEFVSPSYCSLFFACSRSRFTTSYDSIEFRAAAAHTVYRKAGKYLISILLSSRTHQVLHFDRFLACNYCLIEAESEQSNKYVSTKLSHIAHTCRASARSRTWNRLVLVTFV